MGKECKQALLQFESEFMLEFQWEAVIFRVVQGLALLGNGPLWLL